LGLPPGVRVRCPIDYFDLAIEEEVEPKIRLKQDHE